MVEIVATLLKLLAIILIPVTIAIVLGLIGGLIARLSAALKRIFSVDPPQPRAGESPGNAGASRSRPADEMAYRPRPQSSSRSTIVFTPPRGTPPPGAQPTKESLDGLHDAFTGAQLNPSLGLYQCRNCSVYYHAGSVEVLRQENNMMCVACGATAIIALSGTQAKTSRGRDYSPNIVTLATFRAHFDRVVTFEGRVHSIRVSRRGSDFAVMFEHASWTRGLKLVFFRGTVREVGGTPFIQGLAGKTVRVRGLLINHSQFGPEIIISERSMILSVSG